MPAGAVYIRVSGLLCGQVERDESNFSPFVSCLRFVISSPFLPPSCSLALSLSLSLPPFFSLAALVVSPTKRMANRRPGISRGQIPAFRTNKLPILSFCNAHTPTVSRLTRVRSRLLRQIFKLLNGGNPSANEINRSGRNGDRPSKDRGWHVEGDTYAVNSGTS